MGAPLVSSRASHMTLQGSKALSKHQLVVSPSMCVNSLNSVLALEIAEDRRGELSPDILLWKLRKFLPWGPQRCSSFNMSSSRDWTFLTGWLQMSLSATLLYPEKNPLQEGSVLSVHQSPGQLHCQGHLLIHQRLASGWCVGPTSSFISHV